MFDVAVIEGEVVTVLVAGGGEAGEGLAVVHGDEEPGIVNGAFIFIADDPEIGGADGGGLVVSDKCLVTIFPVSAAHQAAADPAVHGIAADPGGAVGL